jgi:cytochrome c oxidase subunit 2
MCSKAQLLLKRAMLSLVAFVSVISTSAWAEAERWQVNMTPGVTEIGHKIYGLHMLVFWICVVAGVGVFGYLIYSMIAFRKSKGAVSANFHENTTVEILWTVIPFLILIGIAVPSTTTLLEIYDTDDADLDVLITGYQWKWKYEYLDANGENVSFFSNLRTPQGEIYNEDDKGEHYLLEVDEPLVLPTNKKIRFLVTANDVLHSWWVPEIAVKRDAVPGFINEAWSRIPEAGIYRGQCTELCGRNHGYMPIVVNAVEQDEFDAWIGERKAKAAQIKELMSKNFTLDEQMAAGQKVYMTNCVACHGANGEGGVGKPIAGSAVAMGELNGLINVLVNGRAGTAMPAFGNQLNDVDLSAVITFARNGFGNKMGDVVQPIDVFNFKQGQ